MSTVPEKTSPGFLLLDAMIGMSMAVLVTGVLGAIMLYQNRALGSETHRVFARQGLRSAVELMAADLRSAGHRFPGVGYGGASSPPGICAAAPGLVRVAADLDADGDTTGANEDVTYCRCAGPTGGALYRAYRPVAGSGFVVEPVADDVSSLQFAYGPRSVSVSVTMAVSGPLGTYTQGVYSDVSLRNGPEQVACAAGPTCPPADCR